VLTGRAGFAILAMLKRITIHTDGACEGNPGPGGWAAILRYGAKSKEISGGDPATTNNRMEMQAAIEALASVKEQCEIDLFTDSEYLKNGMTEWLPVWKAHRWGKSKKKAIKNEDPLRVSATPWRAPRSTATTSGMKVVGGARE
jgi:ribonuclease HI